MDERQEDGFVDADIPDLYRFPRIGGIAYRTVRYEVRTAARPSNYDDCDAVRITAHRVYRPAEAVTIVLEAEPSPQSGQ